VDGFDDASDVSIVRGQLAYADVFFDRGYCVERFIRSDRLGVYGRVDGFDETDGVLIERKIGRIASVQDRAQLMLQALYA
jgi:hypothetical protein